MKDTFYLVVNRNGANRLTRGKPSRLNQSEPGY